MLLLLLLSRFSRVWLCDPIDGSPPGYPTPGILQARTLEWVAISFSNAWKWRVRVKALSRVGLLATPWMQPTRLLRHTWSIFLKFLPEIIDETRISIISISLQHYPGGLLSAARAGNEIKSIKIGKEEINLSLFMENMITYVENPQESTDKP